MNITPQYAQVENRPIPCNFCGATVHGKVIEKKDTKTNEIVKECRWICSRCNNLSKIGNVR